MSSKYPSVTARERNVGRAGNFPRPVPRPANDNKMGSLILEGAGLALARKVNRFDPLIRAYIELGQEYHRWLYPDGVLVPTVNPQAVNPAYWSVTNRCPTQLGGTFYPQVTKWFTNSSLGSCSGFTGHSAFYEVSLTNPTASSNLYGHYRTAYNNGVGTPTCPPNCNANGYWIRTSTATRRAGAPNPTPVFQPLYVPVTVPAIVEVPFALPLASPLVRPAPIQRPLPGEEPSKAPSPRPRKEPRKDPAYRMPYVGVPYVMPGQWPGAIQPPGAIVGYDPDGEFVVQPAPTVDTNAPPRALPGLGHAGGGSVYHEGKSLKKSAVVGAIWSGVGTVTEAMDFAVAMHKSITNRKHRLSDKASKAQVVKYMFTHPEAWRHIDFAEGLRNFVNMQIGDYVAALGSNSSKKLAIEMGLTTGLDRALAQHGNRIFDYVNENGQMDEFAPQVDYDPETGEYTVSGPGFSFGFQWKKGK